MKKTERDVKDVVVLYVETRAGSSDRPPESEDDFERAQELCQDAESAMLAGVLMFGA